MYAVISIHKPHPQAIAALRESMVRFGDALRSQPGFVDVHTIVCEDGTLFGLALWEDESAYLAGRPAGAAAVRDDPFDEWESGPIQFFSGQTGCMSLTRHVVRDTMVT